MLFVQLEVSFFLSLITFIQFNNFYSGTGVEANGFFCINF